MARRDNPLTHFDAHGQAHMVDVAAKDETHRVARARAAAFACRRPRSELIASGQASKGDVIGIARIAAIQATKRTAELIPLCHPLPLTRASAVEFEIDAAAQRRALHGAGRDAGPHRRRNGGAHRRAGAACSPCTTCARRSTAAW